ncbi:type VI immunity family protein [Pseudomonas sp. SDO528_S397]
MNNFKKLAATAPDLSFELADGTSVVKLGLIATIYFKEGYTTEKKIKVMECFRTFYKEFSSHLNGQLRNKYEKLSSDKFEKTAATILTLGGNDRYELQLTSAKSTKEAESYGISTLNTYELHEDSARSYIKIVLPWNTLETTTGRAQYNTWIKYLCDQVGADHGYGGLSTILPFDYDSYMPIEFELAQKHSGLEVDSMPHSLSLELIDFIKGVNWQTIISNDFIEKLGGKDALILALSGHKNISLSPYNDGLIIQAGDFPEVGIANNHLLPAYVAVNKIIKPLRIPNPDQLHQYSPYGNCFEAESTAKWYARFDQEPCEVDSPPRIEAGQPCTKQGYWFTPAQSNSRRHFKQGEIMPNFSDSNWGDTLWYWSGEE